MTNHIKSQPFLTLPVEADLDTMVEMPLGIVALLCEGIIAIKHGIVGAEALADWAYRFADTFTGQFPLTDEDEASPYGTPRP